MGYVIDIIIILIVAICAVLAAKKGFIRSLIEFVGFILAIVIAVSFAGIIADYTYENAVKPVVTETISSTLSDSSNSAIEGLPDSVVSILELSGIDINTIKTSVGETANEAAVRVTESAVKPVVIGLVKSIATIIISVILFIVVSIVARLLNSLFRGLILGSANKILGAALGGAKGIIFSAVFCILVSFIASVSKSDFLFFSSNAIENSIICKNILSMLSALF